MEKEDCLKIIKDALDEVFKEHGNDYLSGKGDTVPTTYELMKVIREHYDDDDLLDEFDEDDMLDHVDAGSSWGTRRIEERLRKEYDEELQEEIDALNTEEKRSILDVLENGTPDEVWSLIADYGMCGNYDYAGVRRALFKLIEKLQKSNYNERDIFSDIKDDKNIIDEKSLIALLNYKKDARITIVQNDYYKDGLDKPPVPSYQVVLGWDFGKFKTPDGIPYNSYTESFSESINDCVKQLNDDIKYHLPKLE